MRDVPISSLRPDRIVCDIGDLHYRGSQIQSIVGGTTTFKVQVEANIVGTLSCLTSLVPAGAQRIGFPCYVRVTTAAFPYTIVEVFESNYADWLRGDPAASVARGEFHPGVIPRSVTGEPLTWWKG